MNKIYIILLFLMLGIVQTYSQDNTGIDSSYVGPDYYRGEDGKIYTTKSKNLEEVNTMSIFAWGEVINKALTLFMGTDEENESSELMLAKAEKILSRVALRKIKVNRKVGRRLRKITKQYEKGRISLFEYIWLKANLLGLSVNELEQIEMKAERSEKIYLKYIT